MKSDVLLGACQENCLLEMTEIEEGMESDSKNVMEVENQGSVAEFQDMPVLSAENLENNDLTKEATMDIESDQDVKHSAQDITEGTSNSSSDNDKTPLNDSSVCRTPSANQSSVFNSLQETPPSGSGSKKRKRLTPEERRFKDQDRQEKRRKLEEEKQRKEQERLEKLKIKEEEKKKRDEEKRTKEEEKKQKEEERNRKAEEDRLKKEEEKQRKEDERLKREEEKKKKEEERLQKEEQRRKKEEEKKKANEEKEREKQKLEEIKSKQAQLFTSFFKVTPPSKSRNTSLIANSSLPEIESEDKENENSDIEIIELDGALNSTPTNSNRAVPKRRIVLTEKKLDKVFNPMPFQLKTDMNLPPLLRRPPLSLEERNALDGLTSDISEQEKSLPVVCSNVSEKSEYRLGFIEELKTRRGRKSNRTEVKYDSDVQVIVSNIIDNPKEAGLIEWRMKLIQFHDNRRPPYWGTYKRKPIRVKGRKPFVHEQDVDYEFDSDDEWEDEPEDAEDLENSDKEEEKEPDDPEGEPEDEEDEEGWMVPHGYLSDGEGGDHVDIETMKTKEKEFYKSRKQQTMMGLPFIETEELSEFKIILFPGSGRRKIRRSRRSRKAPSPSLLIGRTGGGILSLELPNSDNEDESWSDDEDSDDSGSSDSSDSENESGVTSEDDLTPNEGSLSSDSDDEPCQYVNLSLAKGGKRNGGTPQQPRKKPKPTPLSGGVSTG